MNRFPLSIDLQGKPVFLIGNGMQIQSKREKLSPFGAVLIQKDGLAEDDLSQNPALVIVGDIPAAEAEPVFALCVRHGIPVNVVDVPRLCTFHFPALITRGSLTVAVTTGGKSPEAAAFLCRRLEEAIPDRTGEILDWIALHREDLRNRGILRQAVCLAFRENRPLVEQELQVLFNVPFPDPGP